MSITQTITELPDAPTRQDPDNFSSKADAFLATLEGLPTEQNNWADQANTSAAKINADAVVAANAANAATLAAVSQGATIYSSGTTYAAGDLVLDPAASYAVYVSQVGSNTGNTPSSDGGTNWKSANNFQVLGDSADGWFI